MRTASYQYEISEKRLHKLVAHMQTAINNFKQERGHDSATRLHVLENDALALAFHIEKHELLYMMIHSPMIDSEGNLVNESAYEVRSGDTA